MELIRQTAKHEKNFTCIDNEILFRKVEDKPIPLEALGLFYRLLSLPKDFNITEQGLCGICGCGSDKLRNTLKILNQAGYIHRFNIKNEKGEFMGYMYVLLETTDETLWNSEDLVLQKVERSEIKDSIPETDLPLTDLPRTAIPFMVLPLTGNTHIYKICNIIKYEIYKIISKNNKLFLDSKNFSSLIFSNKIKKDDTHLSSSPTKENYPLRGNNNTEIENNTTNSSKKPFRKTQSHVMGAKLRNNSSTLDDSDNKQPVSVQDLVCTKLSDLTDTDNQIARMQKQLNEQKEQIQQYKESDGKVRGSRSRVCRYIESTFSQYPQLIEALKSFVEMYVARRGAITLKAFQLLIKDLKGITEDSNKMIDIVNCSIKRGYLEFYPEINSKPTRKDVSMSSISSTYNLSHKNSSDAKLDSSKVYLNSENDTTDDNYLDDEELTLY